MWQRRWNIIVVRWRCLLTWTEALHLAALASELALHNAGSRTYLEPQSQPKSSCALTDHGCLEHEMEAELICLAIRRGVSSTGASKDAVAITCAVRSVRTKQRLEPDSVGGWWIRCLRGCAFSVLCVLSVCVFRRKQVARGFTYVAPTPHRILREKHRMDSSAIGGIDGTRPTMH